MRQNFGNDFVFYLGIVLVILAILNFLNISIIEKDTYIGFSWAALAFTVSTIEANFIQKKVIFSFSVSNLFILVGTFFLIGFPTIYDNLSKLIGTNSISKLSDLSVMLGIASVILISALKTKQTQENEEVYKQKYEAQNGNIKLQYKFAKEYYEQFEYEKAYKWLQMLKDSKTTYGLEALVYLANMSLKGFFVKQNIENAIVLYDKARIVYKNLEYQNKDEETFYYKFMEEALTEKELLLNKQKNEKISNSK